VRGLASATSEIFRSRKRKAYCNKWIAVMLKSAFGQRKNEAKNLPPPRKKKKGSHRQFKWKVSEKRGTMRGKGKKGFRIRVSLRGERGNRCPQIESGRACKG